MTTSERVAIVGTGLIGTSIAMAAVRAGDQVRGFDVEPAVLSTAAERSGLVAADSLEECVHGATLVVVCTPIPSVAETVARALETAPEAVVTDVASVKSHVVQEVSARASGIIMRICSARSAASGILACMWIVWKSILTVVPSEACTVRYLIKLLAWRRMSRGSRMIARLCVCGSKFPFAS